MIIILISGILFLFIGIILIYLDKRSKKWIETYGIITKSKIKAIKNIDLDTHSDTYSYNNSIEYEYKIGNSDKYFIGHKIFPYGFLERVFTSNSEEKVNIHKKLLKGSKIKIFYNPKDYSESCIITGSNYNLYTFLIVGIIILSFYLSILVGKYEIENELNTLNKIETIK